MTRRLIAGLAAVSLALSATGASAQEAQAAHDPAFERVPPSVEDAPAMPPPVVTAPATVRSAPARTVRIHARSKNNKQRVTVAIWGTGNERQVVCSSEAPLHPTRPPGAPRRPFIAPSWGDCVANVPVGAKLLVTFGKSTDGQTFVVPNEPGSELDLKVLPADRSDENGIGVAMVVIGGVGVAIGGLLLAISSSDGYLQNDSVVTPSIVAVVLGAAIVGGGIALLVSGSRAPRVKSEATQRPAMVVGDIPWAGSREPSMSAPPALTPLSYTFTF